MRCRHRDSWIVFGGLAEWCYRCGAWRKLKPVKGSAAQLESASTWVRPVGAEGENPWSTWQRRNERKDGVLR